MEIIENILKIPECALALGNFDGLHIAHIKIINSCIEYARKNNLKSGVMLFKNHTKTVCEKEPVMLLTNLEEKIKILEKTGVDFVFLKDFDESLMKLSPEEFYKYLVDDLNAKALFIGYDYKFGHKASGDTKKLLELGEKSNIFVSVCDRINIDNMTVSSSKIRELINSGKVDIAKKYLDRLYELSGVVVEGKQNGTKMGLPTANVEYSCDKLLPPDGVYKGITVIDGVEYKSLINVGKNPTFNAKIRTVESHIVDFSNDLYGKFVTLKFIKKIRDEKKFSSYEELQKQIKKDLKQIDWII